MSTEKSLVNVSLPVQIKKTYRSIFSAFRSTPIILSPFLIFVLIELIALVFLFLIPRAPLRSVLGPIVATLWSEIFLHYPSNFLLLPKLASFSRMALTVLFGSLLTGVAVNMYYLWFQKKTIKPKAVLRDVFKKYAHLFIAVLLFILIFYFTSRFTKVILVKYFVAGHAKLLFIPFGIWLGPILSGINFILAILLQCLFVYVIPLIVIEKLNALKSILRSVLIFRRLFLPTIIIVTLAMVLYLPIVILIYNSAFLLNKFFPEIILWVLFFSTLLSSLVIDPLITLSATQLYLANKEGTE